jgi:hypothetical protein
MATRDATRAADHFSLRPLARALQGLPPPNQAPDPTGAWSSEFTLYSLNIRPWAQGSLKLTRSPETDGAVLTSDYVLGCGPGVSFRVKGETRCESNQLATPKMWTVTSRQHRNDGQETHEAAGDLRGTYDGQRIVLTEYGRERPVEAGPLLTWNWGLFDAVQRLAVISNPPPLEFALLDHFDQVKPEQALRLRKRCRVTLGAKLIVEEQKTELEHGTVFRPEHVERGGTEVDCVVFEHTGRGILPIVYWCTTAGYLLMVSSGLEAYVRQDGRVKP